MISPGWLVLLLGFDSSAVIVLVSDALHSGVRDIFWAPAIIGAAAFFWGAWVPGFILTVFLDAIIVGLTIVTMKIGSKGIGQADVIALTIFGLWPAMAYESVALACLCVFLLNFNRRYIPRFKLAGWLSLFVIPVGLVSLWQGGAF